MMAPTNAMIKAASTIPDIIPITGIRIRETSTIAIIQNNIEKISINNLIGLLLISLK